MNDDPLFPKMGTTETLRAQARREGAVEALEKAQRIIWGAESMPYERYRDCREAIDRLIAEYEQSDIEIAETLTGPAIDGQLSAIDPIGLAARLLTERPLTSETCRLAAIELRRLHDENKELRQIKGIVNMLPQPMTFDSLIATMERFKLAEENERLHGVLDRWETKLCELRDWQRRAADWLAGVAMRDGERVSPQVTALLAEAKAEGA